MSVILGHCWRASTSISELASLHLYAGYTDVLRTIRPSETLAVNAKGTQALFKGRHFEPEIIILCVRHYLRFALSYRNLEELMAEHNLSVDQRYDLALDPAVRAGTGTAL